MSPQLQRAIFLDRDGVINFNRSDHVKSWDEFEFLDGALLALERLAQTEFEIVIVSNQAAIGRGQVTREAVEDIHRRMVEQIEARGGRVSLVRYCPHRPEDDCACRKPRPGLLRQAARERALDLTTSYFVGDALEDVAAARAVGATPILVRTGRGAQTLARGAVADAAPEFVADDLGEAVEWILARERVGREAESLPRDDVSTM